MWFIEHPDESVRVADISLLYRHSPQDIHTQLYIVRAMAERM